MQITLSPMAARILGIAQDATKGSADEIVSLALVEFATKRNLQHAIFRLDWIAQREAELATLATATKSPARARKIANGTHPFMVTSYEQVPNAFRLTLEREGQAFRVLMGSVAHIWHAMTPQAPEPPTSWVGVTVLVTCRNGEPARFPNDEPGTAWVIEAV